MAKGIVSVMVCLSAGTRPHHPVRVAFHEKLVDVRALTLRRPPGLLTRAPIGPAPPPKDWRRAMEVCQLARDASEHGTVSEAEAGMEAAYKCCAATAELGIESLTGSELPVHDTRGRDAKLVWRPIRPESGKRTFPKVRLAES